MEWMILFTIYGLSTKMLYDGDGRKTQKYTKDETKEKIPRLVVFPSPHLRSGGRLLSGVQKHWKTSQTYPNWERVLNLMGEKKDSWVRYGQLMAGNIYWCITLTVIVAKVYKILLLNSISIEKIHWKNQYGFQRNWSTTSQILTIWQIIEGLYAKNLQTKLLFIDFSKTFDSIQRGKKMEQMLLAYGYYKRNCYHYNANRIEFMYLTRRATSTVASLCSYTAAALSHLLKGISTYISGKHGLLMIGC